MTERKMRKVVAAGTVVAVVTLFILIFVLIFQMATLSAKKREFERQKTEFAELQEKYKDKSEWLKFIDSDEGREYLARTYGYVFKTGDERK